MALFSYNDPMLSDVERTIDRMFDRGFGRWGALAPVFTGALTTGPTRRLGKQEEEAVGDTDLFGALSTLGQHAFDVVEKKDMYELIADAPGFDPKDIQVDLNKNVLTITGKMEKEEERKEEGKTWRRERRMQRFQRAFTLPEDAKHEGICAKLDKGVLTVCVPKVPEAPKPEVKRIQVQQAS